MFLKFLDGALEAGRGLVYFCLEKFLVAMESVTLKVTMEVDRHLFEFFQAEITLYI